MQLLMAHYKSLTGLVYKTHWGHFGVWLGFGHWCVDILPARSGDKLSLLHLGQCVLHCSIGDLCIWSQHKPPNKTTRVAAIYTVYHIILQWKCQILFSFNSLSFYIQYFITFGLLLLEISILISPVYTNSSPYLFLPLRVFCLWLLCFLPSPLRSVYP